MSETKGKSKVKKVLSIIGNVLMWLFLALCLVMLIFAIVAKRSDDGAVNLFGREMRIVMSPSMEKNENTDVSNFEIKDIPVRSLVITETVPEDEEKAEEWYDKLKVGDVLTFRYFLVQQETITHRIIAIDKLTYGYVITLRGDNASENEGEQVIYTDDRMNPHPSNFVIGRVVHVSVFFGNIIYILQQPIGIALVIIVPASLVIIYQIVRLITYFRGEKRKKAEAKQAEQEGEIEALKRRIAEMEKAADETKTDTTNTTNTKATNTDNITETETDNTDNTQEEE